MQIDPRRYVAHHPTPAEIFLLLEIADTTLERDCKQKAAIYGEAGIADYWILDVNARQVHVFREIVAGTYQRETVLNEEATLSLLAFPDLEVQIEQMFP